MTTGHRPDPAGGTIEQRSDPAEGGDGGAAPIRAAGGVLSRVGEGGRIEVLLVHRPRYDDWTFPKGKAEAGERWREAAYREVLEETGYRCVLGDKLGSIVYRDGRGRPKEVRYWTMTVVDGAFEPNDEVDCVSWCDTDEARQRLSYDRDVEVLDRMLERRVA